MEKFERRDNLSPERQLLQSLEASGNYVFHGSGADLDALEPRQAYDEVRGDDGPPAVFASDNADYAVFMAVVNKYNCPKGSRSRAGTRTGNLTFGMTKDTESQLTETAAGYVYVFEKNAFSDRGGMEFVTHKRAIPIQKIKVRRQDLPPYTLFEA